MSAVRDAAHGKWVGLLKHFGVDEKYLSRQHTSCPICKMGTDRYRFTNYKGNGEFWCNTCGSGDGIDLLSALTGWTFREAAEKVEEALGQGAWVKTPDEPETDPRQALNATWLGASPVRRGDETDRYLRGRGLTLLPPSLRTHPGIPIGGRDYPAMLAMIVNVHGQGVSIHQTLLERGSKAPIDNPKRTMPPKGGRGATTGCTIRLWHNESDVLHIAEGIETACAVRQMTTHGDVWATKDAHLMEHLIVPKNYSRVEIWTDVDESGAGEAASGALKRRLYREGIRAVIHYAPEGHDWLETYLDIYAREKVA